MFPHIRIWMRSLLALQSLGREGLQILDTVSLRKFWHCSVIAANAFVFASLGRRERVSLLLHRLVKVHSKKMIITAAHISAASSVILIPPINAREHGEKRGITVDCSKIVDFFLKIQFWGRGQRYPLKAGHTNYLIYDLIGVTHRPWEVGGGRAMRHINPTFFFKIQF